MSFQYKAQIYFIYALLLLSTLIAALTFLSYVSIRDPSYLDIVQHIVKQNKMPRDEIEREIGETKKLILSNDMKIVPFEMYTYLVLYETLRDVYKKTALQSANNYEKYHDNSDEYLDLIARILIEAYNMNRNLCINNWFNILRIVSTGPYQDKKSIMDYIDNHKESLSEYCKSLYKK